MTDKNITLEEVSSAEVRKNIAVCTQAVDDFATVLRCLLEDRIPADEDSRIGLDMALMHHEISAAGSHAFLDDGNTCCDGMDYEAVWAFPLDGKPVKACSIAAFREGWTENCLYFLYSQGERLTDHKAKRFRMFSLYISGPNTFDGYPGYHRCECIARNNDNHPVASIVNRKTILFALKRILEIREQNRLACLVDNTIKGMRKHLKTEL